MRNCDICGGLRLNGRPLQRDEEGNWAPYTGTLNPTDPSTYNACRSCAKEKLG